MPSAAVLCFKRDRHGKQRLCALRLRHPTKLHAVLQARCLRQPLAVAARPAVQRGVWHSQLWLSRGRAGLLPESPSRLPGAGASLSWSFQGACVAARAWSCTASVVWAGQGHAHLQQPCLPES